MRDELTKFLIKIGVTWNTRKIAELIIADGWVKLPCKVGQIAYFIIEDYVTGEIYMSPERITDVSTKGLFVKGSDITYYTDIGKTVFFDCEEAKEAVKLMKRKNNKIAEG